jgi:hypothetical protein
MREGRKERKEGKNEGRKEGKKKKKLAASDSKEPTLCPD